MLFQALKNLVREVKARMMGVAFLECLNNTEALLVVIEASLFLHQEVESLLTGVSEGGMSQIVGEGDRFGKILVETQRSGYCAADRGNLNCVSLYVFISIRVCLCL